MNSKKLFATVALSTTLLAGCTFGQPKDVIVKVNGDNITMSQFNQSFDKAAGNSMFSQMGIDAKKDKTGFVYLMLKNGNKYEFIDVKKIDEVIIHVIKFLKEKKRPSKEILENVEMIIALYQRNLKTVPWTN